MKIGERIVDKNSEKWICQCGNEACYDGFWPCDAKGEEMEPDKDTWLELYICGCCGAIIDKDGFCVGELITT